MRDFSEPQPAHRPLLRWRWNDVRHTSAGYAGHEDTLRRQLRLMHHAGFGGVIFPPCRGRAADAELAKHLRAAVEESKELGLSVWLCDEAALPSDSDEAHLTRNHPDWRARYLKFHTEEVPRGVAGGWRMPTLTGRMLCLMAVPLSGPRRRPDWSRALTLTTVRVEDHAVLLSSLGTDARIYLFTEELARQRDNNLDVMNAEAVRLLLEGTHDLYHAALGNELGMTVTGLYAVSPTLWSETADDATQRFPWSPLLAPAFSAEHGYDLIEKLPSLIADTGSEAARVRQDFWKTVVRLIQEAYWQPLCAWAGAHNLLCSGVVLREESLGHAVARHGDAVPPLRALSAPGIAVPCGEDGGLHARLCASVAALQGSARAYSTRALGDIWNGCGWSETLYTRLPSLHHLLRQGINCFVAGAARTSLHGSGQQSLESVCELHQPYRAQWKPFADYIARCSSALAQGRAGARVGLLWPARSGWSHYNPKGHRLVRWVEEDLRATAQLLDELHFDFLLLPEDDLCAARCEPGHAVEDSASEAETPNPEPLLLCGAAQLPLEMVVLPSVTALSWAAWHKLEEFVAAGGKVVCLGLLPRWSERGRDEEFEKYIGKATLMTVSDLYDAYAAGAATTGDAAEDSMTIGYPVVRGHHSGGRMCCYQPRLNTDADDARLRVRQLLMESITPELETQTPNLVYTRRICHGEADDTDDGSAPGDLYFIFNAADEARHINLRLRPSRSGSPYILNAWTGERAALAEWMPMPEDEGGGLSLALDLVAHEARLMWIEHGPFQPHSERANFTLECFDGAVARGFATQRGAPSAALREHGRLVWWSGNEVTVPPPLLLPDEWSAERLGPNVLILEDWQWQRERHVPGTRGASDRNGWQPLPPRQSGEQQEGPFERVIRSHSPEFATFRTLFPVEELPTPLFLTLDSPDVPIELYLNEERLAPCAVPFPDDPLWGDVGWQWFDLSGAQSGSNILTLIADYRGVHETESHDERHEAGNLRPQIARLVGDFSLSEAFGGLWDDDGAGGSLTSPAITKAQPLLLNEGSWHEQGLPLYSGAVQYSQRVEVPRDWQNCRIFLELSRMRDAVEASINGRSAGVRVTAPYRFDVTAALRPDASNELRLRVWNTAEAALRGHLLGELSPSGLLGPVRFVAYPIVEIRRPQ